MSHPIDPSVATTGEAPSQGQLRLRHHGRPTIAFLNDFMDLLGTGYETQLRHGLQAACRRHDLNLLLVFGRGIEDTAIYESVTPASVDGVILGSGLVSLGCAEKVAAWLARRPSLPVCCAGFLLPGVPSVVVDNRPGMRAVIEHLIRHHQCRKLAYLGGIPDNPDTELRFEEYRGALRRHGLPFDRIRVADGHFVRHLGERAMLEILDRDAEIDGVVAANDGMALGAIQALRSRGFRVPRDVPVTGFDDLEMARLGHPPLTTVRQPLETIAETAVEQLVDQLHGRSVPLVIELPAEARIRQSCGCHRSPRCARLTDWPRSEANASEFLLHHEERIIEALSAVLGPEDAGTRRRAARLVTALRAELTGETEAFDGALEEVLEDIREDNESHQTLQEAIGRLREELSEFATPELVEIWDRARRRVALANTCSQAQSRYSLAERYEHWMAVGEEIAAAFDLDSLRQGLIAALGSAGIPSCFVSLYTAASPVELEPYLATLDGQAVEVPATRYSASLLFPPGFGPADRARTWVVLPLAFRGQRQGIAAFEHHATRLGYQMLSDQIGAALRSARLHQEIVGQSLLHERIVQERLAANKRMQSLSVLAGGVAHDLNNALGPLVALPDVILGDLARLEVADRETLATLQADVESIRAASVRAAQTIKDLLTLGRQGRTSKEPLDLNRAVIASLGAEPLVRDTAGRLRVTLELCREPLMVMASESQLARAFGNLFRNAAEAIAAEGAITVKSSLTRLAVPVTGYETIEAGEYAVLTVSDTGSGIPAQDLGRVFEPFFSKKKVGETSGTGLGLAIVHGVVKEHDGFVDVTSTLGRGTTFALYFPHLACDKEARRLSSVPPRGHARILVVDDEPVQLRTARRVLAHLGYEVDTLESGQQAYELFVQAARALRASETSAPVWRSPYDLVILDMVLNEDEDGLRVFERIRRLFPEQRGIISSGHAPTERAELAVARELPWLTKPYTADTLERAIRASLSDATGSHTVAR